MCSSRPSSLLRFSRRDALLLAVGAVSVFVLSQASNRLQRTAGIPWRQNVQQQEWLFDEADPENVETHRTLPTQGARKHLETVVGPHVFDSAPNAQLHPTQLLQHAPGWTAFENLYMSNGTLYLVTSDEIVDSSMGRTGWPLIRMMTSTGLPGYATPESILEREPTDRDMAFITPEEANRRWGHRVSDVSGVSVRLTETCSPQSTDLLFQWLFNDPPQFLNHYYRE